MKRPERVGGRMTKQAVLRYHNLILIIPTDLTREDAAYMFEDKMCSHDVLHQVTSVMDLETADDDPHGMFKVIGVVDSDIQLRKLLKN